MKRMKLNNSPVFKTLFLAAILLGSMGLLEGQEFAGGQGTEADPWQVATAEHLNNVRNYLGEEHSDKYFIQTANIDLTDFLWDEDADDYINDGKGWEPIGPFYHPFQGHYNGDNHEIEGVYINRPEIYHGLFGWVVSAVIENLGVTNVDITGGYRVGGLVGLASSYSTIRNTYVTGSVTGDEAVGGLAGIVGESTLSNSYFKGNVTGNRSVGGLVGSVWTSTIRNSHYNYEQVLINGEHVITTGALNDEMFNTWFENNLSLDIDEYLNFDGDSFLISSVRDFKKLLAFGQVDEYSYQLTTNLDLTDHPNLYIPYLSGDFDGGGFVVDNLTLTMDSFDGIGLFGYVGSADIENLGVTNVDITGYASVGSLAGSVWESAISNNYSTGSVKGTESVGGLSGGAGESTIINSYSTAIVNGNSGVGGFVGVVHSFTILNNSFSTGSVTGNMSVGGLVGSARSNATISNSYSTGDVTLEVSPYANPFAGGLVGCVWSKATISNSYSTGSLTGERDLIGGLVGMADNSTITNSYWDMQASGIDTSAGGEGRTTEEMTYPYSENTYIDWDFDEIWKADEDYSVNSGYPYLQEVPTVSVEDDMYAETPFSPVLTNYPNPFNPYTNIDFSIRKDSQAELVVYNIRGQLVKTLHSGKIQAGEHRLIWNGKDDNGRDVSSGVYFYRLKTGEDDKVNKMLLVK